MSTRIIDRKFFLQPAAELAPQLLGKVLYRTLVDGFTVRGRITVTEAYCYGESFNDLTKAEKKGGHLYVIRNRPSSSKSQAQALLSPAQGQHSLLLQKTSFPFPFQSISSQTIFLIYRHHEYHPFLFLRIITHAMYCI